MIRKEKDMAEIWMSLEKAAQKFTSKNILNEEIPEYLREDDQDDLPSSLCGITDAAVSGNRVSLEYQQY